MNVNNNKKTIIIVVAVIVVYFAIRFLIAFGFYIFIALGFNDNYDITTNIEKYNDVIGKEAKDAYSSKWGMSEEIFPAKVDSLSVEDFKMVYYDPWDKQFLSYLVVNYNDEEYDKEVKRLNKIGIDKYIGNYSVTGFSNYKLISMNADEYQGFVYAITDEENKIIYVELIFCNYYMDIDYEKQIPLEYLPDGFNAKINNPYGEKMLKKGQ